MTNKDLQLIKIGKQRAEEFLASKYWMSKPSLERVRIQYVIAETCLPPEVLGEALEEVLGHPVASEEILEGRWRDTVKRELLGDWNPSLLQRALSQAPPEHIIRIFDHEDITGLPESLDSEGLHQDEIESIQEMATEEFQRRKERRLPLEVYAIMPHYPLLKKYAIR